MEVDRMTLSNVGSGAAEEKFQQELANVINNILDPNTDWDVKRQVVVKLTFIPGEARNVAAVLVECSSKLAAQRGSTLTAFFGVDTATGEIVCQEYDPGQMKIGEDREETDEPVTPRLVKEEGESK